MHYEELHLEVAYNAYAAEVYKRKDPLRLVMLALMLLLYLSSVAKQLTMLELFLCSLSLGLCCILHVLAAARVTWYTRRRHQAMAAVHVVLCCLLATCSAIPFSGSIPLFCTIFLPLPAHVQLPAAIAQQLAAATRLWVTIPNLITDAFTSLRHRKGCSHNLSSSARGSLSVTDGSPLTPMPWWWWTLSPLEEGNPGNFTLLEGPNLSNQVDRRAHGHWAFESRLLQEATRMRMTALAVTGCAVLLLVMWLMCRELSQRQHFRARLSQAASLRRCDGTEGDSCQTSQHITVQTTAWLVFNAMQKDVWCHIFLELSIFLPCYVLYLGEQQGLANVMALR